ncbi:hypothetical protein [Tabrizicola sp.]|uniref:hypothetical protein n=1 Tax=Tabrizicola sp. TaxID=2005166 RepID=UPI0035AF88E5
MAKSPPKAPTPPPPTVAECWLTFWAWVLGVPLAVAAALGVIWAALWTLGSMPMEARAGIDMMTTLWWLGVIVLLYPAMLWVWWGDLREGIRAAQEWEAMTPEARAAALAEAAAAKPKRRSRKKG